ncbi:hypothetical protein [Streptomyces sp. NPDC059010]|uniref:hypothetical protein n=1 Tax=Streptomyces sp. NPDC059010 TaxID=3346695 RepID=UPI0036ACC9BA
MNPELPDLDHSTAADEMMSRTTSQFTTILLGLGILVPWLLFVVSIISGTLWWLTALNLIGTHVGLLVMLRGYRDDNRALKRWGTGAHATTMLLCLVVAQML